MTRITWIQVSEIATQVCDAPLLRADVTRLDSLGEAPPLEDEGPLRGCHLLTQDACDARQVVVASTAGSAAAGRLVKMSAS